MTERFTPGIADEAFIRDKVPMTKEEVRTLSICKLHLKNDSVLFDVGSGTGSIAVEAAGLSSELQVYAIETKAEAVELIKKNAEKFSCPNIHVVQAFAPEGFEKLPVPTHAFIGGSKGNLEAIIKNLKEKNPRIRIVMNGVSLEAICDMQKILSKYELKNDEVVQVCVSKACKIGDYHLLQANNPVFIFSFEFV